MAADFGQPAAEHFFNESDIRTRRSEELLQRDGPTPGRPDVEPEICRGS
jgi:hypothetical protein